MAAHISTINWQMQPDEHRLALAAAHAIRTSADAALRDRDVFKLVLAGGKTPETVYTLLTGIDADWNRWRIYFGDERCLAADDPDRNSAMAARCWLDRVAIPAANIHPIPAELGPAAGADAYTPIVRRACPFDVVLLGMGEDGHTASIFPGQSHNPRELVHAVYHAPKPPPQRVSLSLTALNDAREIFILITGRNKHDAVHRWRKGVALPIARVHGCLGTTVFIDTRAYRGEET